jgi:hypothetical protein
MREATPAYAEDEGCGEPRSTRRGAGDGEKIGVMPQAERDDHATIEGVIGSWRHGDALRAVAHFGDAGEYAEAGHAPIVGRDAMLAHFTRFFRDGPPWRMDVDDIIIGPAGACVVYRFAVEGSGAIWRERAGCAVVKFDPYGAIAAWREYEG